MNGFVNASVPVAYGADMRRATVRTYAVHLQWAISQRRFVENQTAISPIYNHAVNFFLTAVLGEIHFRTVEPAVYGLRLSWTQKV